MLIPYHHPSVLQKEPRSSLLNLSEIDWDTLKKVVSLSGISIVDSTNESRSRSQNRTPITLDYNYTTLIKRDTSEWVIWCQLLEFLKKSLKCNSVETGV